MLHLKIENPGVCPTEGFTLFGATTKRRYYGDGDSNPLIIGTFGSGNKHSTCLLLREDINPVVFCGLHRMSFYTKPVTIKGVGGEATTKKVCVRHGGKTADDKNISREEELSVTLDYGTSDWGAVELGLREYVSNALDACFEQGMDVMAAVKAVKVEIVDENQVRAKAGTTRVFVPVTPDVQRFFSDLGKWFLHFSEPQNVLKAILPKNGRNRNGGDTAVIYRRGVYVREWNSTKTPSVFDYNLGDLRLNEARTADDWNIRYACGQAIAKATEAELAAVFRAMKGGEHRWEFDFDSYGLSPDHQPQEQRKERAEVWQRAFSAVAGEDGVLMNADHPELREMVARKGYSPVAVKADAWVKAGEQYGLRSDVTVLTEDDRVGRTYSPATDHVNAALDWAWETLVRAGMTNGKAKPPARCFYEPLKGESQTWGLYKGGEVFIHTDIANGMTDMLRWVMLEEVGHYVTGATDLSRDFQTFFIRLVAKLAS